MLIIDKIYNISMGGESSSVFPQIENVAYLCDTLYFWIDPNINN
jgi:hypothetical protein